MRQAEIDYWISCMVQTHGKVSDLNITVGKPLQVEVSGVLRPVPVMPPVRELTPFQAEVFALNLIGGDKRLLYQLVSTGSCDLSYFLERRVRFRVNIFSQKKNFSIVLRRLESAIPTISNLKLAPVFNKMAGEKNGLILVTGATGTGKTTTLAAILNKINEEQAVHIITLEDPVEYVHPHKKATFNQRELGADFDNYLNGLRAALRQAPKVILVGEMRDRETMEIALAAAETGHLVLSTVHTVDAGQTINRIIGMFEQEEEAQIRNRLADMMRWIVCQRLLPGEGGGRQAAFEIMSTSMRVKEIILDGESEEKTFYNVIKDGQHSGMQTFDQNILQLFEQGLVSEKTALAYCSHRSEISRGIDQIKATRGETTTSISGLGMEEKKQHRGF
jgi:twitching motility protein PilT